MSYLVFARKYRPQTFEEVVEQTHVTQTLTNAISAGRVAHAILFSGPRGTGKTTIARILAKAMNCEKGPTESPCNQCRSCREITAGSAVDVFEIDGASNNGVEQVRELRENIKYMPAHSRFKIYIIDEVHMLSTAAFNALLKTLEEPPAHVMFLFATTEPRKIPVTILSRCQRHDLKRIASTAIRDHLTWICDREDVSISAESLELIARQAGGSLRDSLSLLDQAVAGIAGAGEHEAVLEVLGMVDRKVIFDISNAILEGDAAAALDIVDEVYQYGTSITDFYAELIDHFRHLLMAKLSRNVARLVDLPAHEIEQLLDQARNLSVPYIQQILDILVQDEKNIRWSARPKMILEVAIVKMLQIKPALPIDELIEKIDRLQKSLGGRDGTDMPEPRKERRRADSPPASEERPLPGSPPKKADREAPEPGSPKSEATQSLDEFAENLDRTWQRLKEIVSEKHLPLGPNLAHSRLTKLTDGCLEIEVNGSPFNLKRVKKKDCLEVLKTVSSDFFGRPMDVKVRAGSSNKQPSGRPEQEKVKRLKQELLKHPVVADAIEIFNGKLVDIDVS